jgi:hypothetical protein
MIAQRVALAAPNPRRGEGIMCAGKESAHLQWGMDCRGALRPATTTKRENRMLPRYLFSPIRREAPQENPLAPWGEGLIVQERTMRRFAPRPSP